MAGQREKGGYPARTPNQIVAYNLMRARKLRGLSQEEAAERLAPFLGARWSKATFSAAERTYFRSERQRRFDPDEIVAFARAFDLPVGWFFLPPDPSAEGRPVLVRTPDMEARQKGLGPAALIDLVVPPTEQTADLQQRLADLLSSLPVRFQSEVQRRAALYAASQALAAIGATLGNLGSHEAYLRDLADRFAEARKQLEERVTTDAFGSEGNEEGGRRDE